VAASIAVYAEEPVGEYAAGHVSAHLALDEARDRRSLLAGSSEKGLELFANDLVKEGLFGLVALVVDGKPSAGTAETRRKMRAPRPKRNVDAARSLSMPVAVA